MKGIEVPYVDKRMLQTSKSFADTSLAPLNGGATYDPEPESMIDEKALETNMAKSEQNDIE